MSLDFDQLDEDELMNLKHDISALITSQGWYFFEKFMKERVQGREQDLLTTTPSDIPEFVNFARIQGGIEEARIIPQLMKAVLSDIERFLKEMQLDDLTSDQGE